MGYFILLLAILFPWGYGIHEAKTDAAKIAADGSRDSLKETFHSSNLIKRGITIFLVCAMATVLANFFIGFPLWFLPVLITYCASVFGYVFTSKLNTLRGLPKWYVSRDPKASKTDRMQVRLAAKLGVTPYTFAQVFYTLFLAISIVFLVAFIVVFN